jgi:hypothetical protein
MWLEELEDPLYGLCGLWGPTLADMMSTESTDHIGESETSEVLDETPPMHGEFYSCSSPSQARDSLPSSLPLLPHDV